MIDHLMRGENMDKLIGVTAVSTPLWLHYFNTGVAVCIGIGGLALLVFRIAKARQEYLEVKRRNKDAP
ncbi:hypothetical protein [Kiloniella sp. EL199]|uniref:hypothetical protein n=1 Tax=Kiloniella sp. EL199 TaxID=2107581 RepID=UPI000EA196BA|nr:hypothetical protein [Kiloniella sp. EL199]